MVRHDGTHLVRKGNLLQCTTKDCLYSEYSPVDDEPLQGEELAAVRRTPQNIRAALVGIPDDALVPMELLDRLIGKSPTERKAIEIAHRHMEGRQSATRDTVEAAVREALSVPPRVTWGETKTSTWLDEQVAKAEAHYRAAAEKNRKSPNPVPGAPLRDTFRWMIQNGASA